MIFLVWLRVEPLPGCKVTPESGADTLECALEADAKGEVHGLLDAALHRHRQRVRELEACIEFDPAAWDDRSDPDMRVRDAAAAASERDGVHFTSFGLKPPET